MRRAFVLIFLAACGKAPPPDPLLWRGKPEILAEFSDRNNYPIAARQPALRGKLIVIDMTTVGRPAFIDYYYSSLQDLVPKSREEVGTIAWIRHFRTPTAKYSDGNMGYQETYELTLVDAVDKQAIWTQVFQGEKPPAEVSVRKSEQREIDRSGHSGGYPDAAVIRYLQTLPRR